MAGNHRRACSSLVLKLSHFSRLSEGDIETLDALCAKEERFAADVTLLAEGEPIPSAFVLIGGMACRYRLLSDGRRQILTFLIPGDFCDLSFFLLDVADHSVATLVPTRIAAIEWQTTIDMILRNPRIGAALWWAATQEAAMLRERIVALGRRNARGRVAYLLCELVWRHAAVGMSEDHAIRLPLTQSEIADSLGLTAIHVNRVLQEFRSDNLITLEHRRLKLLDIKRLQAIAEFNESYLHFAGGTAATRRYFDELQGNRARSVQLQKGESL